MKNSSYLICIFLFISFESISQEIDTEHFPPYKGNVSQEEYNNGKQILTNSYAQVSDHSPNYLDYWNVAVGYLKMGVSEEIILSFLEKSKELSEAEDFCYYILATQEIYAEDKSKRSFKKVLGNSYLKLTVECKNIKVEPISIASQFDKKKNLNLEKYNEILIDKLIYLFEKDQRYRSTTKLFKDNKDKQRKLDNEVRVELSKIFDTYGYPGKDLVSEEFSYYGCSMLEHTAGVYKKEKFPIYDKYFPLVAKAYKNGNVPGAPFKMLIDRIYIIKTGKQIFGTHVGEPFAEQEVIDNIKKEYDLQ